MTKYAWSLKGDDDCEGPFKSKEEALRNARRHVEAGAVITLGIVKYAIPADHIQSDMDGVLDSMNENACDNGFFYADEIFVAKDGAQDALTKALETWVHDYVTSSIWNAVDGEDVVL